MTHELAACGMLCEMPGSRSSEVGHREREQTISQTGTAVIRVHRGENPWRDRLVPYSVQIDDGIVGEVVMGESRDFLVVAGEHRIRLKLRGLVIRRPSKLFVSKAQTVVLRDGDIADLNCGPSGPSILFPILVLFPKRYIKLEGPRVARSIT
jgi:hypothetical protein